MRPQRGKGTEVTRGSVSHATGLDRMVSTSSTNTLGSTNNLGSTNDEAGAGLGSSGAGLVSRARPTQPRTRPRTAITSPPARSSMPPKVRKTARLERRPVFGSTPCGVVAEEDATWAAGGLLSCTPFTSGGVT